MTSLTQKHTVLVFQAGGPTPVINATLAGFAQGFQGEKINLVGVRRNFEARTRADLLDLSALVTGDASPLIHTPGAVLGSSRTPIDDAAKEAMLQLAKETGAAALVGIGGNGTLSSLAFLAQAAELETGPLYILGLPKTVDNDIPNVHFAPGYGSAARFVALAVRDFDQDFRAMQSFDQVTILETMGRNTGWIAAAGGLLTSPEGAPHMTLVPEVPVALEDILERVAQLHRQNGRVFIVSNEVLFDGQGQIIGAQNQPLTKDRLGRVMHSLGHGVGMFLAQNIRERLGLQTRVLRPGNLGRAMSCCVSPVDRDLAYRCGQEGAKAVLGQMGTQSSEYLAVDKGGHIAPRSLSTISVESRCLERQFFDSDALKINKPFRHYAHNFVADIPGLFEPQFPTFERE